MEIRFQNSPKEVKGMSTEELRSNFLVQQLMKADTVSLVYSHYDRVIVGGVKPVQQKVQLHNEAELRADYFLQRRELGIINVGGSGIVEADGVIYELNKLDALYLGKGTQAVSFASKTKDDPASFFLMSTTAHHTYPNTKMTKEPPGRSQLYFARNRPVVVISYHGCHQFIIGRVKVIDNGLGEFIIAV